MASSWSSSLSLGEILVSRRFSFEMARVDSHLLGLKTAREQSHQQEIVAMKTLAHDLGSPASS